MDIKLPTFNKKPTGKKTDKDDLPAIPLEPIAPPVPSKPELKPIDVVSEIRRNKPEVKYDIGKNENLETPEPEPEKEEELEIPDDFTEEELIDSLTSQLCNKLIAFRDEMAITPVKTDFINLAEAAQLCTIGITGNDFHFCLMKQEERDKAAAHSWLEDHKETLMVFAIIFAFIVIGTVIIYNVMGGGR